MTVWGRRKQQCGFSKGWFSPLASQADTCACPQHKSALWKSRQCAFCTIKITEMHVRKKNNRNVKIMNVIWSRPLINSINAGLSQSAVVYCSMWCLECRKQQKVRSPTLCDWIHMCELVLCTYLKKKVKKRIRFAQEHDNNHKARSITNWFTESGAEEYDSSGPHCTFGMNWNAEGEPDPHHTASESDLTDACVWMGENPYGHSLSKEWMLFKRTISSKFQWI